MTAHYNEFFYVFASTDRFQSLYQINRNDMNKGKCVKTDDNTRNIYMMTGECTLTGVHQTFDRLLTLIRERILQYIEVTVKPPFFLYFFGLELIDWVRFPFQINL